MRKTYFPQLLKWTDNKHGNHTYYLIKNAKQLNEVSFYIFKIMMEYHFYKPNKPAKNFETYLLQQTKLSKDELNHFLDLDEDMQKKFRLESPSYLYGKTLYEQINSAKNDYYNELGYYKRYELMKQILKNKEVKKAYSCIRNEECIELTTFDNIGLYE